MDSVLYTLAENIREQNYVIATYYIKLPKETDVFKKASTLAIGQTIGTWIPIPGITDEIREKYMGEVVNIFDVSSLDLATQIDTNEREYIIQIAYPAVNFSTDLPLMITSLLGNDASTSAQVKLLDIEFPEKIADGKSVLGLMAIDYKKPVRVISEDVKFMKQLDRWAVDEAE